MNRFLPRTDATRRSDVFAAAEANYRQIEEMLNEKYKDAPRCPTCGAHRLHPILTTVCAFCGAKEGT